MTAWHDLLRAARIRAGFTQADLAGRVGVAERTIRNHERGRIAPARERLVQIARALDLDVEATNAILTDAGHDPEPIGQLGNIAAQRTPISALQRELSSYRWPCYVLNERQEIIYWNDAVNRVSGLDFAALTAPRARHLLRIAATRHFRERAINWAGIVGPSMAFLKMDGVDLERDDPGSRYVGAVVADIVAQEDGAAINALYALWLATPAYEEGGRLTFFPEWRAPDGTVLRFNAVQAGWNDFDAAWTSDWQPADATTWEWLERQLSTAHATDTTVANDEPPPHQPWGGLLTQAREASGLSQRALAELSGLSAEIISSYERGKRSPRRRTLLLLTRAMELDGATTNTILAARGMEPEPSEWALFLAGLPKRTVTTRFDERRVPPQPVTRVQRDIGAHTWPCLVLDGRCEIVAWNDAAAKVLGLDFERDLPDRRQRNFIRFAVSRYMRERIINWRDVIAVAVPSTLGQVLSASASDPSHSPDWLVAAAADIERDDVAVVDQLRELWRTATPTMLTSRLVVPLIWQDTGGTMLKFSCIISRWNPFDPFWAVDLHPADPATWRWLGGTQGVETQPATAYGSAGFPPTT